MNLKQMLCHHDRVEIARAHPNSGMGRECRGREAWTDIHGVLNFVKCSKCGLVLHATIQEPVYGNP